MAQSHLSRLFDNFRRLRNDERGNVAMIMAILLVPLVGAVGYGIDYTRAVSYKMKLDSAANAAALAGMDTARTLLSSNHNMSPDSIKAAAIARALQVFVALAPQQVEYVLTCTSFTRVGETISASVCYVSKVPTTFLNVVGVQTLAIDGASKSEGPLAQDTTSPADPNMLVEENFDKAATIQPDRNVYNSVGVYKNFNNWVTNNDGVEIGTVGFYGASTPTTATYVAELDGFRNTYLAKKVYLDEKVKNYELRYWYKDRTSYNMYLPVSVFGSSNDDVEWANGTTTHSSFGALGAQSNRIGVYLDRASTEDPPAVFSENLIDACLVSHNKWIERSVKISVAANGFYWLAFQAEGASEGLGGVLHNIRFCKNACPGAAVADTFPWPQNTVLFQDNFTLESSISADAYIQDHRLNVSGATTAASLWQNVAAGWTTTPINQIEFSRVSGRDYILPMDAYARSGVSSNRSIHRKFLLAPGYYKLYYEYAPNNDLGTSGTWCGALTSTPINLQISQVDAAKSDSAKAANTNRLSVYVDADVSFSHPETTTALYNEAVWKAWDGANPASGAARLPKTRIDSCVHSTLKPKRTVYFKITKVGHYWLTFAAEGAADGFGPLIDSIALTAMGGLSITEPPSPVSVPPHGLASGSTISSTQGGYTFTTN
jgi:Flp pilus assembly protein TadG